MAKQKELVPRFRCPLCGWMAYYSQLENSPHDIEVHGVEYTGFQSVKWHRRGMWGVKREYKRFLRVKVLELAQWLGVEFPDVDVDAIEDDDEEADVLSEAELEELGLRDEASGVGRDTSAVSRETVGDRMVVSHEVVAPVGGAGDGRSVATSLVGAVHKMTVRNWLNGSTVVVHDSEAVLREGLGGVRVVESEYVDLGGEFDG